MTTPWQFVVVLMFISMLAEGIAILALGRSIGLLYVRLGPPPAALETSDGIAVGLRAPELEGLDQHLNQSVTVDVSEGRWGLVFVSVTCGECRLLVQEVGRVNNSYSWGARIAVISHGTHEQNQVLASLAPRIVFISDPAGTMHDAYQVRNTPYAFLVEDGQIRAKGIVNHRDHLEALLNGETTHRPDVLWTRVGMQTNAGSAREELPHDLRT